MSLFRLLVCSCIFAVAHQTRAASYRETLVAAHDRAAERSWEQARVLFSKALEAAPDSDARLWCELWVEDATWRSEMLSRPWERSLEKHLSIYERLDEPYRNHRPKDDFWAEVTKGRADFECALHQPTAWNHYAAVADYLSAQFPSAENAHRYVRFLQQVIEVATAHLPPEFNVIEPHLVQAARIAATKEDRAWCKWQLARISHVETASDDFRARLHAQAQLWSTALSSTKGTRWDSLARAEEFLWRVSTGWAPQAGPDRPANIPALLDELKIVREKLLREKDPSSAETLSRLYLIETELQQTRLEVLIGSFFRPQEPVRFSFGTAGFSQVEAILERVTPAAWILLPNESKNSTASPIQPLDSERVQTWHFNLPDPAKLSWSSQVVDAASSLPAGLYFLTVHTAGAADGKSLVWQKKFVVSDVSGLALVSALAAGKLFAQHLTDGSPAVDMKVSATVRNAGSASTWSGNLDSQGAVEIPILNPGATELIAMVGDEPVWFTSLQLRSSEQTSLVADVYTDRPLFRPGEMAHWKVVLRQRSKGIFSTPADTSDLALQITSDERDELILLNSTPLKLNSHGAMSGEIEIPATARAGTAQLTIDRRTEKATVRVAEAELFKIDNFVPPPVRADIAVVEPGSLHPGGRLTVRLHSAYFSGGPIVGAPATIFFAPDMNRFGYLPESEPMGAWLRELAKNRREVVTDGQGEAVAFLDLPSFLSDGVFIKAYATLKPEGTPAIQAETQATISSSRVLVDPQGWTKTRLFRPAQAVSASATMRDGSGSAVPFNGQAQLMEIRWSEVWIDRFGRVVSDDELNNTWNQRGSAAAEIPDDWKLVHAEYTETILSESSVHAELDGHVSATFTPDHPGIFRIRFFGSQEISPTWEYYRGNSFLNSQRRSLETSSRAEAHREVFSFVVADEKTASLAINPETAAVLVSEVGETDPGVDVLGIVPAGNDHAWLSIEGETQLLAAPAPLVGRLAWHAYSSVPSMLGQGRITFLYSSKDLKQHAATASVFDVSSSSNRLHVSIEPAQTEQRPGEAATVEVAVRNSSGQPIAGAELAVAVSDEAVNRLGDLDKDQPKPVFDNIRAVVNAGSSWSVAETKVVHVIRDGRTGAIWNPSDLTADQDDDVVILSPFVVESSEERGYAASMTLAGSRLRTELQSRKAFPKDERVSVESEVATVKLRTHFTSTAFWTPAILSDAKGSAHLTFSYPDNLTQWRVAAYAIGEDGNTFGTANTFTRTSLPFQARLQLPRFLIVGDSAEVTGNLVNRSAFDVTASAKLNISDAVLVSDSAAVQPKLIVPRNAEAHATWSVHSNRAGSSQLTLTAQTGSETDAMVLPLSIFEDGIQQKAAALSRLEPSGKEARFSLASPLHLDATRTTVSVQLSPNHASVLLDALPYLIDYPYGCVEQTTSRFLPAVIVRKILVDLGLDEQAVERRILLHESRADQRRRESSAGFEHFDDVVQQSFERLAAATNGQGFGWWPDAPESNIWMTAYVSWSLSLAQAAGIEVPRELREETNYALARLLQRTSGSDDASAFAWAALARAPQDDIKLEEAEATQLFGVAFNSRQRLSASGRACLALASKTFGSLRQREILLRNLDNGVVRSKVEGLGTAAHWGGASNYWRATEGPVESTALTLLALLELDPHNPLIEPAANWLTLNRRGTHWSSTRDTAFAVLALGSYLKQRGNLAATGEVELIANARSVQRVKYSPESLLTAPREIPVPIEFLQGGEETFVVRRLSGNNPVFITALSSSWARGEDVKPAAHLIEVKRDFERLKAEPTLIGTLRVSAEKLSAQGTVVAGEEITARVTLKVPNEMEYVMIEVPKPAGCEPLNPLSGWDARIARVDDTLDSAGESHLKEGHALYREEHDDRSVFFLEHIEPGTWELRFGLRATTVGEFRALPVTATAMYVPEIAANSDAQRLGIKRSEK